MSFKTWLIVVLFSVSCAHSNKTDAVPKGLQGKWQLVGYECNDQPLGSLAQERMKSIESGLDQEFYIVSGARVEHHSIERQAGNQTNAFCETIYGGIWSVHDGLIEKSTFNFVSREGKNGYKCYEAYRPQMLMRADGDWPYELANGKLRIVHKDISVKITGIAQPKHFCDGSSDVSFVYRAQ